jgi:NTE family protein
MQKKKLGLALGSGAWRGLVHIGVLKSLEENKIKIDCMAGSSVGAIMGGLYAYFGKANRVENIVKSLKFLDMAKVLWDKPLKKGEGVICGEKYEEFFRKIVGDVNIEDLKIPYVAVCADLKTGKLVNLKRGSLARAMRASSAIPVVFRPIKMAGKTLVDGGAITPVPVDPCRKMGGEVVLGVSLYGGVFPIKRKKRTMTRFEMAKVSRFLPLKRLADYDLEKADIKIEPIIEGEDYGLFANFVRNKKVIDCGKKAMDAKIGELKNILG